MATVISRLVRRMSMVSVLLLLSSLWAKAQEEPGRYALVVGISNYKHGYALLDYAGDDAEKVHGALKELGYQVSSLTTDAKAGAVRASSLADATSDLFANRKAEDTVLFYFSGHGSLRDGKQYLLCTDTDPNRFAETAFSLDVLKDLLKHCQARHRVLIIDACRDTSKSEGQAGFEDGRLDKGFKDRLDSIARSAPAGVEAETAILYACRPGQRSKESDDDRAGIFTIRFVNALTDASRSGSTLTVGSVMHSVASAMPPSLRGIQDPILEGASGLSLGTPAHHGGFGRPTGIGNGHYLSAATRPVTASMGDVWINPKDGAEMVWIPGGEFEMGTEDTDVVNGVDYLADARPVHKVRLSGYWMYRYDVTVGQYKKFCQKKGRPMPPEPNFPEGNHFNPNWSHENHPMVNVSWNDAVAYCAWAGVTLPSEAQWERAAKGPEGFKWPFGDTFDAGLLQCSTSKVGDSGGTAPVGKFPANGFGLYDMAGNVWQWCLDYYDKDFYASRRATELDTLNIIDSDKSQRVERGGSWYGYAPVNFRCAYRSGDGPGRRSLDLGFRGVLRSDSP